MKKTLLIASLFAIVAVGCNQVEEVKEEEVVENTMDAATDSAITAMDAATEEIEASAAELENALNEL
ncbi:hypothetical protein [Acidiluteibacter ferrifornacis]|uniref:Lipoprotein n=1 Tax=Acidiluteibacter ferrifornacis TaxID=2692424 RepID=A0A6N9NJP5_9FLAO|nr:hypothetical protein [Acidiluteibacter ferrifornacis]MBR9831085.1 hypothetical protein [bacterium]NBG66906.1 hypothetical protein [Acidiluteibacter ferrifornacis]